MHEPTGVSTFAAMFRSALVMMLLAACAAPPSLPVRDRAILRATPQDLVLTGETKELAWRLESSVPCTSPSAMLGRHPLRFDGPDRVVLDASSGVALWKDHPDELASCGGIATELLTWTCADSEPPLGGSLEMLLVMRPVIPFYFYWPVPWPTPDEQTSISSYGYVVINSPDLDYATLPGNVFFDDAEAQLEDIPDQQVRAVPPAPLTPGAHALTVRTGPHGVRSVHGLCLPETQFVGRDLSVHEGTFVLWDGSCHDSPSWEDIRARRYELEARDDTTGLWQVAATTTAQWAPYACPSGHVLLRVRATLRDGTVVVSNEVDHPCVTNPNCIP